MSNLIACRLSSYGEHADRAWTHLPELGIRHLELAMPESGQVRALQRRLEDHGMFASSLQANCEVARSDAAEAMTWQIETCAELGAEICFLSAHAGDTPKETVYEHLRAIGEVARKHGVIVALETHPDLVGNGDDGRATMEGVNHPNIRVNFDTANIYFYNHGADAATELAKELDFVAAVHLKDTTGEYHTWNFPALGTGVVDFRAVFRMLGERGFTGPYTMELEGVEGHEMDLAERLRYVSDSVKHLRDIGAME